MVQRENSNKMSEEQKPIDAIKLELGCNYADAIQHLLDVRTRVLNEGKGYHYGSIFIERALRGKTEIKAQKITANAIKKHAGLNAKIGKRVIREHAHEVAAFNGETVERVLFNNQE